MGFSAEPVGIDFQIFLSTPPDRFRDCFARKFSFDSLQ